MFKRYQIESKPASPYGKPISRFKIVRHAERCLNCGQCERLCIYRVHARDKKDTRQMAEPDHGLCKNCFRCIQECPVRALTMINNPDYEKLGNSYWRNDRISTIWFEAETGRIPVLGAGYRGTFGGPGFDGLWTDMSEIVRPTRDGIHGREYINTSVDLGRKPSHLVLEPGNILNPHIPLLIEISLPVIFDTVPLPAPFSPLQNAFLQAAEHVKTFSILPFSPGSKNSENESPALIPMVDGEDFDILGIEKPFRIMEIHFKNRMNQKRVLEAWSKGKSAFPETLFIIRLAFQPGIEEMATEFAQRGVEAIHLYANNEGEEYHATPSRYIRDLIRSVHLSLVKASIRDEVTLMVSGGFAAAEHLSKAIICGADIVGLDLSLAVALGCQMCPDCDATRCPAGCDPIPFEWAVQRIVNLMRSWHDQLLEILSAMGLREVRRLRGETGRAIFQEKMEEGLFQAGERVF